MKEIDNLIRASIAVVKARREAKRAQADGASAEALKKYSTAFHKSLDALDAAVAAVAKIPKTPAQPTTPFDWGGLAKAAIAMVRMAKSVRRGKPIEDVIDAEVIG